MSVNLSSMISSEVRLFSLTQDQSGPGPFLHKHSQLTVGINKWKKIFQNYDHKENATIGIIHNINFEYFCILYAAMSLGFNFVILDSKFDDQSTHKNFLPLDFLVYDSLVDWFCDSMEYWETCTRYQINAGHIPWTQTNETDISMFLPAMEFDRVNYRILSAVTSGTTSEPKKILHNYQYFIDIAERNSKVLNLTGKVAHLKNLHHGSSLPVFFLPSAMTCDFHLCLTWTDKMFDNDEQNEHELYKVMCWTEYLDINHILCPYPEMLLRFLQMVSHRNMEFTNLKLYTLYYIDPDLKKYIKNKNIEIVSIFGCTETSGPTLINRLNNQNADNFDPTIFYAPDDFFSIELEDSSTRFRSRCGTIDYVMDDQFVKLSDNCFKHLGRSNFYRINDVEIKLIQLQRLKNKLNINGEIIVDLLKQSLYLAVWDQTNCKSLKDQVNEELKKMFNNNLIYISKSANLNKFNFVSGIKPNQDLVRDHFRQLDQ